MNTLERNTMTDLEEETIEAESAEELPVDEGSSEEIEEEEPVKIDTQIKAALEKVSEYLRVDGGDVQFVGYKASTGEVSVRLQGHCAGCVHAQMTIKNLVEQSLKEMIGEDKIKKVVQVM
jgi:Fe-S cluster biogenesis protein NfuA